MTSEAYMTAAMKYLPDMPYYNLDQLEYGLIGLNGEAGEAIDILKKAMFQGHKLDHHHLVSELGDVLWCLACSANAIGYSLDDLMKVNLEKLEKRYPEGHFSTDRSINRAEDDI